MMRVVLDTNVILVSIGRTSPYRPIFDAFKNGNFTLLITSDIYFEYYEQFEKHTNKEIAENFCRALNNMENVEAINVSYKWNLITSDPDDNKFADCALTGNADFLVTNDAHFNALKTSPFPPLNIISAEDFIKRL